MTSTVGSRTRRAVGEALTNDPQSIVNTSDAKKIVETALGEIASSKTPELAFEKAGKVVADARRFLGSDARTAGPQLDAFKEKGRSAVDARLGQLAGGKTTLPTGAKGALSQLLKDMALVPSGKVEVSNVAGNPKDGFTFDYKAGGSTAHGFALKRGEGWFLSQAPVAAKDLDAAEKTFRSYFDENWAQDLRDNGSSAAQVRTMRANFTAARGLFGDETDPTGLCDSYPLVIVLNNSTGSDHGCYVGMDPATGNAEAATFN